MIYFVGVIYIVSLAGFALSVGAGGLGFVDLDVALAAGFAQFIVGYLAASYIDAKERAGK